MWYNPKAMEKTEILQMIEGAEREVSALMLHAKNIISMNKTDAKNVVTEYDTEIQARLIREFSERCPRAHFFCEEMQFPDTLNAEQVFIIDPIDGTMNFVHGLGHSCISVACANNGVIDVAAIYNPYFDEMFTAIKGRGAYMNGREIHVDDCGIENGVVCLGTAPYYPEVHEDMFKVFKKLFDMSLDARREGSAALDMCTVAAGRACFFYEPVLSLWDFAAGSLIVSEAGGLCLNAEGKEIPLSEDKSSIICGGRKAVEEFLAL